MQVVRFPDPLVTGSGLGNLTSMQDSFLKYVRNIFKNIRRYGQVSCNTVDGWVAAMQDTFQKNPGNTFKNIRRYGQVFGDTVGGVASMQDTFHAPHQLSEKTQQVSQQMLDEENFTTSYLSTFLSLSF